MTKNINTLSPEVIAEIAEIKRHVDRMRRGGDGGPYEPSSRFREKQVRIARTTTGLECSSYPAPPANTFVVELGQGDFDLSCGLNEHTFTPYTPSELRYAHSITDEYYKEGETVIIVLIHDKWYLIPRGDIGSIAFTMLEDRSRELIAGLYVGHADATIDDIAGNVPDDIGDTVEIVFVDQRWLAAVEGCQGRADYIGGKYLVTECQELEDAWFTTAEDRTLGAPEQDVTCTYLHPIGHTNGDMPANVRYSTLTVRFLEGEYPDMRSGAMVRASHNNDYKNKESNEGMRWIADVSDQLAILIRTTLTANMCGTDPQFGAISATTAWPFSQKPVSPEIKNLDNEGGEIGDTITCARDSKNNYYYIINVTKHVDEFPINLKQTTDANGCTTISWGTQEIYYNRCKPATAGGSWSYKTQTVQRFKSAAITKNQTGSGSGSSCTPTLDLTFYEETAYVTCNSQSTEVTESLDLDTYLATVDVYETGGCIYQTQQQRIDFGGCGDAFEEQVVCGAAYECDSGSGS